MDHTRKPIEILKNGKPAIVHLPANASRAKAFGSMKHTLLAPPGDLIQPLGGIEWDALKR